MPPASVPDAVDILGKPYAVTIIERTEGDYGECLWNDCRIEIASYQCEHQKRDTILHEVMHGIDHEMHGNGGAVKEAHIRAIATGLLAVLRHNPALVAFLVDG